MLLLLVLGLRLVDDIEGVDDAGEVSEAAEEDVDQKTATAAVNEDNCDGREQESSNECQQPRFVFSAASLALPLSFALASTHVGSLSFRICTFGNQWYGSMHFGHLFLTLLLACIALNHRRNAINIPELGCTLISPSASDLQMVSVC